MVPTSIVRTPSTSRGSTSATMNVRLPISCFIGWSSRRSTDHRLVTVRPVPQGVFPLRHRSAWVIRVSTQTAGPSGIDRYFGITERGSTVAARAAGRSGHLLHDGLHRGAQPDHRLRGRGRQSSGGARPTSPQVASSTALVAGGHDDPDGRRRALPVRDRRRARPQRGGRLPARRRDVVAGAMGIVVLEGLVITALVLDRVPAGGVRRGPVRAQARHRVGIGLFIAFIGFVDAGFVRRARRRQRRCRSARHRRRLPAGPRSSSWSGCCSRSSCARAGPGRHPHQHRGHDRLRHRPQRHRRRLGPDRPASRQPQGLEPQRAGAPTRSCRRPTSACSATSAWAARSPQVGVVSALLLVFTLMLADFFDTMGTVVGVGAEGDLLDEDGGCPGGSGCCWSTRWPRPPAGRRRRRRTRPTSSRPRAWPTAPAPAWPAWPPACCSWAPCSSRRWSPSSPTRRRRPPSWSSASC